MIRLSQCLLFIFLLPMNLQSAGGAEAKLKQSASATMEKAARYFNSISTHGGYAGIYSLDLEKRYGEAFYEEAKKSEIWVQPPGTPSIGECFLRAFRISGESFYLEAARKAGLALAWGQSVSGGWDHRADLSHFKVTDPLNSKRIHNNCTFDDNITQGALTFLIALDDQLDERWLDEAIKLALGHLLESQYPNGAWPQWYPLRGSYHDYYTFNDNAINDCIRVMLLAHGTYHREEYLESARRAGEFIIISQIPAPQAGWAQQYTADLKPAWARAFEPPGVCTLVTSHNIRTLVDLYFYTGERKYLAPVPEALKWLESVKLMENLWARLYEYGTNRPIYGDRDSKIHYTYEEISQERKSGYGFRGEFGIAVNTAYYNKATSRGAQEMPAESTAPPTGARQPDKARLIEPQVDRTIKSLDAQGRWVSEETIRAAVFVRNFNLLCQYLEAAGRDN